MSDKKTFLLMNKNVVVLSFCIIQDIFSENYIVESIENKFLIPRNLRDLQFWISERYILNARYSVGRLLELSGISDIDIGDFIEETNCISLKDTYWVKRYNSTKTWKSVSPYENPFNEVISDYSFWGLVTGSKITGSPDFSTDGRFPKCWKRNVNDIYLYKAGTTGPGLGSRGNEPYSEVYACKIAEKLGIDAVKYTTDFYKGRLVSKCKCMTNEKIGLILYKDLHYMEECNFSKLLQNADLASKEQIRDMLLLDYVTCNVDRHYGNIGVFIENDTNIILGFAPLFDHNMSCLPYCMENDTEDYISNRCAKDGRTWKELYCLIDSPYTREKLELLLDSSFEIGERRDKIVSKMVRHQVEAALKSGKEC